MHPLQWVAVIITIGLNALDGFDILASAFAAPGIAGEWHISREALGLVLSMELWGMVAGSIVLGGLTDLAGRRRKGFRIFGIDTAFDGMAGENDVFLCI